MKVPPIGDEKIEKMLYKAAEFAREGNDAGLKMLVERGYSLCQHPADRSFPVSRTPLVVAAENGEENCMMTIIGSLECSQVERFFPEAKYAAIRRGRKNSLDILNRFSWSIDKEQESSVRKFQSAIDSCRHDMLLEICRSEDPQNDDSYALRYALEVGNREASEFLAPLSNMALVLNRLYFNGPSKHFMPLAEFAIANLPSAPGVDMFDIFYKGESVENLRQLYAASSTCVRNVACAIGVMRKNRQFFHENIAIFLDDRDRLELILTMSSCSGCWGIVEDICGLKDLCISPAPLATSLAWFDTDGGQHVENLLPLLRCSDIDSVDLLLRLRGIKGCEGLIETLKEKEKLLKTYLAEKKAVRPPKGGL